MTDGRGKVSICRIGSGARQLLFVAGLAVAVLVAGLPAGADTPESGVDPHVTVTITPDDALSDGQTVFVSGTGFAPSASGKIRQCAGSVIAPECDTTLAGFFLTDADGAFSSAPMTVQRVITTFSTTYNCGVQACALVADTGTQISRHHVSFAAAGTVVSPTSTTPSTSTTLAGGTTVPPTTSSTTTPQATTIPSPANVVPPPPQENILCAIIRSLGQALPSLLGGLADGL